MHSPVICLPVQLSEIRQKANEYRQRSETCQFSPTRTTQQQQQQQQQSTDSESSEHSPSTSSLDEDPTLQPHEQPSHPHSSHRHTLTNGGLRFEDLEEGEGEESEGESDAESSAAQSEEEDMVSRSDESDGSELDNIQQRQDQENESRPGGPKLKLNGHPGGKFRTVSTSPPPPDPQEEGRVPTPVLRETPELMRHHLDRTTPSSGSILTSPPLPALPKPSRTAESSRTAGERETLRKKKGGLHTSAAKSTMASQQRGSGRTARQPWSSSLYLSRGSPKLKRDPSLVSSVTAVPRSSSHRVTLPKSATQPPKGLHSSVSSRFHSSTLPPPAHPLHSTARPASPPPSTISSLASTLSGQAAVRKLDYGTGSRANPSLTVPPSQPQYSHTHAGCTGAQCDICGAWLRRSTGQSTQLSHANERLRTHQSHFSQTAHSSTNHPYSVPVTQPSRSYSLASHPLTTVPSSTPQGSRPNIRPEPQPRTNTPPEPPRIPTPNSREVDEISLSSLSLSNCSVASDLLKRARERREKFWTQPPPRNTS